MVRYEGMFLFDTSVVHEWPGIEEEVKRLLGRIDAELEVCLKFDDRRLAYDINKRKRGTLVLAYFKSDPQRIGELERDVRLSEQVLRVLVLKGSEVKEERLTELKALPADKPLFQPAEDHRGDRHGRFGDRGPSRDRPDRGRGREGRPGEKPREAKPDAAKPAETKPAENKPADATADAAPVAAADEQPQAASASDES